MLKREMALKLSQTGFKDANLVFVAAPDNGALSRRMRMDEE
jgi:hypothetical protein